MVSTAILDFLESEDSDHWTSSSCSSSSSSEVSSDGEVHEKVENFEAIITRYSDEDFKKNLRLDRSTATILAELYGQSERFESTANKGLPKVTPKKEIYIFLWYMANTNTFREMGNLFGVSTAWHIIRRVSLWLITIGHRYLKWPNASEAMHIGEIFEQKNKIPGVIGCIDGTHIAIKAPRQNKESYFNRKRYYSIVLQGVVDCQNKFIAVYCGEPGSLHDSRVLRRSDLYRKAHEASSAYFFNNSFLLGDTAYPSLDWLVPPFKDNGVLTTVERRFNALHSSARVIIEHAFGLLKTRFRRLLHFNELTDINSIVNLVMCACIPHNICVDSNDTISTENFEEQGQHDVNSGIFTNSTRRQQLMEDLINRNIL